MRWSIGVGFAFVLGGIAACSSTTDNRQTYLDEKDGTPAPDGASGRCCPVSTGACAFSGGYRENEACPREEDLCDNMCEQKIVEDEHGCKKLSYVPCSSLVAKDAGPTGAEDAGSTDTNADADDGCPPLDVRESLEGTSCDPTRRLPGGACRLCPSNVECCRHFLVCVDDVVDTWKVLEAGPCP